MKSYFGYIRVSTAKQGQLGSSLQEQRDAILAFAKRTGINISEWYEDRETAAKKGRTQFLRMMAALEKGKATGVILHKIDRGARNLWDWARLQDLIDAGVDVRFAHDDLDLKSRGGRLAADIQAVVAADYVRNLRDEVRKGIRGRLKQGLYTCRAPVGYLDQGKAKAKIIDPVKGPLVRIAFELYATGRYSYETLALELRRRGLMRPSGEPLSFNGMMTMLRNPFYIGIIRVRRTGETFQGIHEPLVPAHTFKTVQAIIDGKGAGKVRRFDFVYRRLLTCGVCSSILTGELQKSRVYYRCHTRACATTGIREDAVNARLKAVAEVLGFAESAYMQMKPMIERMEHERKTQDDKVSTALKLRIAALEEREHRLTDAYIDQALDRAAYTQRKAALLAELAEAREDLKTAEEDSSASGRIERFFELLKSLMAGPEPDKFDDFREAVENLTSNRTLVRKNLEVALRSPFLEVLNGIHLLFGEPSSRTFRTLPAQTTLGERTAVHVGDSELEKRARLLIECLKDWQPYGWSPPEKQRKPNPAWFRRKEPPNKGMAAQ